MKYSIRMFMVLILFVCISQYCEAQTNQWTWIYGNKDSVLNVIGVPSSNNPGSLVEGTSWVENSGKFWMFGGMKPGNAKPSNYPYEPFSSDLWKWDGTNWSFVKGGNVLGSFGFLGIPASTNLPPARQRCVSWKDYNGNVWVFGGGDGMNILYNDLWKWDGTYWTWFGGQLNHGDLAFSNETGIYKYQYGIKGLASPGNLPNSVESPSNWLDSKGNLWVFGGISYYHRGYRGYSNDLWKWDGNYWTWISGFGDSTTFNANYGIKGIPAETNMPERRYGCASWKDKKDQFYIFGGAIWNNVGNPGGELLENDFWIWDGKNWTYLGGEQLVHNAIRNTGSTYFGGNTGRYGIKGLPDTANWPTPRRNSAFWTDLDGNFWLYGVIGISDKNNKPAERYSSFHWIDTNGNLWFYGGLTSIGILNDMWVYNNGKGIPTAINNPASPITSSQIVLLNNPTKNNQLSLISDKYYSKLNWEIIDINGQPIQEGVFKLVSKGSRISATTKSLIPGTYFVKLTGDDKSVQTKKWIRF